MMTLVELLEKHYNEELFDIDQTLFYVKMKNFACFEDIC